VAEADWTDLANSLSSGVVRRAPTAGVVTHTGGGTFALGARSIANTAGAWGLYTNQANFAPTPANKGASVRGAIKKLTGNQTLFAPVLFAQLQAADVNANGYLLGITDGDPGRIALVKGKLVDGLPDAAALGTLGVLRRSTATFAGNTWLHLRLDVVVNTNGDVVLNCFRNTGNVTSPTWDPVPGLDQVIDDVLGANTGSVPYSNGYMGIGARFADTGRTAYWDHIDCRRQA
jgi:hypothetical protein